MGAAGTGGQQRARRRAAGDRRAARRLHPAAHARARRGLLDRRGAVGRDRRPAARRHPGRAAPGRLAAALLRAAAACGWTSPAARRRASTGSRCCSPSLCVPVAFWAGWTLFGRRTAWIAALLAAVNPFLTQYAQEGRMYALLALLGLISLTCWLQAFTTDADTVRRAPAIGFAVSFAAMLYTHNWALFFGAATGIAWLVLLWRAGAARAAAAAAHGPARLRRRGAALRAVAPDRALPGRPTRARRGRRRRRSRRSRPCRRGCSARSRRSRSSSPPAPACSRCCAPRGAREPRDRRRCSRSRCSRSCSRGSARSCRRRGRTATSPRASRRSCCSPRPGFAHAGRLGLVGLALVAVLWAIDGAPTREEQRARGRASRSRRRCGPATSSSRRSPSRSPCSSTTCRTGCATRR